ncbi:unnamed protein product [Ilex paraguariensis]|uniref:Cytochrome c oxidase assembly protein COX11, mitochondrial n=1 Tax=Ilex paraguariensis TaxID=185542 RepID=A0ABC8SVF3_9AQUA
MSLSRLSRRTHLFPYINNTVQHSPYQSRHLYKAFWQKYYFLGANNTSYAREYGFGLGRLMSRSEFSKVSLDRCNGFLPLRTRSLERSSPFLSFHRQYVPTPISREQKSTKMLVYLTGLVFAMVGCSYAAVPLYRRFCQATGYGGTVQRKESVEEKIVRHAQDGTITTREIVVQFNADVADGMPWKFVPTQREVRVKPGESALAFYTAENRSSTPITGVSTYNVTPMKGNERPLQSRKQPCLVLHDSIESGDLTPHIHMVRGDQGQKHDYGEQQTSALIPLSLLIWLLAAVYFNKIQCFCFEEQRLLPGEQIDMPVFFYIDPEFETDPKMDGISNLILSYTFFKISEE